MFKQAPAAAEATTTTAWSIKYSQEKHTYVETRLVENVLANYWKTVVR